MRIAVVGAGYAGLAASWHLAKQGLAVDLFDAAGIGAGASGASTGLLHPYIGKKIVRSQYSSAALEAAEELLQASQEALGEQVFAGTGILRLAMNEQQTEAMHQPFDDAALWKAPELPPHAVSTCGLWIPGGKTVYSKRYLQGLWLACERLGVCLKRTAIVNLADLQQYDRIVLCNGHEVMRYPECKELPLKSKKGQALVCRYPEHLPPLAFSIVGNGHISMTEDPHVCCLGSTYEEEFDEQRAYLLKEKIAAFFPPAIEFEVLHVLSGVRIAPKIGYLPLVQQVAPRCFVFAGLGSRGLLYHALYAKALVKLLDLP